MDWHESEPSEDENVHDPQTTSRKRSSRACDQCRKTKSKCERNPGDSGQCKSCALAGTACTFLGPSYKRGPPKGYIHAIEQRWHQVESLLGAVMLCPDPRVQGIVSSLRQDDLAREILTRVDMGPYGPTGRIRQPDAATKEDFFASVLRSNESSTTPPSTREPSRSRRQSRVSREKVSSNHEHGLSVVPTEEWQDGISKRLAYSAASGYSSYDASLSSTSFDGGGPLSQRRRLNSMPSNTPDWNTMYTMEPESEVHDSVNESTDKMGELSLDENHEIRYHGKASGLHLLSTHDRTDNRNDGGIWALPMARVWPPSKDHLTKRLQDEEYDAPLPPRDVQDKLIELYFTYIHTSFPVINKARFMTEYRSRAASDASSPSGASSSSVKPEPQQRLTPLLLLSIFSIAARFSDDAMPLPPAGKMWEAGCSYMDRAREIIMKTFHQSRPSTVQSLLLLGYREFGIGSMEQGWIYIGMAIRMAFDLGLNCNSDSWRVHGHPVFNREETRTRRQIWWVCLLADRYGSVYMGRPVFIRDGDFDVPLPDPSADGDELWQPLRTDTIQLDYPPVPSRVSKCFAAGGSLSVIVGAIISKIYPVRSSNDSRRSVMSDLESQLDQWYVALPDDLRFDTANKRNVPPPNILILHIRYWGAVLLLNRAFIPNWKGSSESTLRNSTMGMKAFDLSQSAASHISNIVTSYRETFSLKRSSPFLTSFILQAGIMHILTLALRPSNVQASLGLNQAMDALKDMEIVWPSASRAWELLHGVDFAFKGTTPLHGGTPDRHKRDAEDAFGPEKSSDLLSREAFGSRRENGQSANPQGTDSGVQDLSTRIMAHFLGLDVPGVEPSTSFYPGYEWWPRTNVNQPAPQGPPPSLPAAMPRPNDAYPPSQNGHAAMPYTAAPGHAGVPWTSDGTAMGGGVQGVPYSYNYNNFGM